ncbi:uncharacterized protein LOC128298266 isoform X2 [Anopheles moucheti]|uniref:uncharacterized protein LOC128298266 isoform X2 n=1 Tax=Anopheles moucheti TaxID=186751 RepID=UPI0022F0A4E9|nr:uncharacterized protein LOC128298266 isoform X2 [Anopheles moucheti]
MTAILDAPSIERAPTPSPPAPTSPVAVPSRGALIEVAGPSAVASLPVYEERDPDTPIVRSNSNLEMQLREAQLTLEELRQSRANFLDQTKNKIDSALKDHIYSRQIIDDYRAQFDLLPIEVEEQLLIIEEGLDANLASIKEVVQCLQDPELLHQYNWCYSTLAILADLIQAGCK